MLQYCNQLKYPLRANNPSWRTNNFNIGITETENENYALCRYVINNSKRIQGLRVFGICYKNNYILNKGGRKIFFFNPRSLTN